MLNYSIYNIFVCFWNTVIYVINAKYEIKRIYVVKAKYKLMETLAWNPPPHPTPTPTRKMGGTIFSSFRGL